MSLSCANTGIIEYSTDDDTAGIAYVGHWSPRQAADWHAFVAAATSDSELPVPVYIAS